MGAVRVTTPDCFWDAVVAETPIGGRGHTGVDTFGRELANHRLSVSQVEDDRTAHDRASLVRSANDGLRETNSRRWSERRNGSSELRLMTFGSSRSVTRICLS